LKTKRSYTKKGAATSGDAADAISSDPLVAAAKTVRPKSKKIAVVEGSQDGPTTSSAVAAEADHGNLAAPQRQTKRSYTKKTLALSSGAGGTAPTDLLAGDDTSAAAKTTATQSKKRSADAAAGVDTSSSAPTAATSEITLAPKVKRSYTKKNVCASAHDGAPAAAAPDDASPHAPLLLPNTKKTYLKKSADSSLGATGADVASANAARASAGSKTARVASGKSAKAPVASSGADGGVMASAGEEVGQQPTTMEMCAVTEESNTVKRKSNEYTDDQPYKKSANADYANARATHFDFDGGVAAASCCC